MFVMFHNKTGLPKTYESNKIKKRKSELVALVIVRITIKHFYFIYFTVTSDTLTLSISLENIN